MKLRNLFKKRTGRDMHVVGSRSDGMSPRDVEEDKAIMRAIEKGLLIKPFAQPRATNGRFIAKDKK